MMSLVRKNNRHVSIIACYPRIKELNNCKNLEHNWDKPTCGHLLNTDP